MCRTDHKPITIVDFCKLDRGDSLLEAILSKFNTLVEVPITLVQYSMV